MPRSADTSRKGPRQGDLRERIAAAAARIMAEDGVEDFALAKRKALRQLGVEGRLALPSNDEIEEQLRAYRALYQAQEHPARTASLRRTALEAMWALERFRPYLSGPVLRGTAGPYAEIELQLFPENTKEVELFLLERRISYEARRATRYAGDRPRDVTVLVLDWQGATVKLAVLDPRDERLALKTSPAGRVAERAGIAEVKALVAADDDAEQA